MVSDLLRVTSRFLDVFVLELSVEDDVMGFVSSLDAVFEFNLLDP